MVTDENIGLYTSDVRVYDFANNLSRRWEYNGKCFDWYISMIDIEILFNSLREHEFIENDTPRDNFFAIFNPRLEIFENPVIWKDIKELVYFFDKCAEYQFYRNNKYQSLIEKFRLFKTVHSKGEIYKIKLFENNVSRCKK